MEKFSEIYEEFKIYILFFLLLIVCLVISGIMFYHFENNINYIKKEVNQNKTITKIDKEKESDALIVDIKGEVKTPGVYYLEEDKRIIDVVNKAGGLTKKADTSANNLSMKIKDEMVIIIYSKDEIKDYLKTKQTENDIIEKCQNEKVTNTSCALTINGETKETNNDNLNSKNSIKSNEKTNNSSVIKDEKISLNKATKEELMSLSGIGEAKAIAIIEYRKNKQFETIEEIKKVSGIGDSLFEEIKNNITT